MYTIQGFHELKPILLNFGSNVKIANEGVANDDGSFVGHKFYTLDFGSHFVCVEAVKWDFVVKVYLKLSPFAKVRASPDLLFGNRKIDSDGIEKLYAILEMVPEYTVQREDAPIQLVYGDSALHKLSEPPGALSAMFLNSLNDAEHAVVGRLERVESICRTLEVRRVRFIGAGTQFDYDLAAMKVLS